MVRRPVLKVGDVVRLSKKGCKTYSYGYAHLHNRTMIVAKVIGDGYTKQSLVVCHIPPVNGSEGSKKSFSRRALWATGYNVNGKNPSKPSVLPPRSSYSGKSSIQAPKSGKSCSCSLEALMAFGCKCGGV
jgi:hypothetical protein